MREKTMTTAIQKQQPAAELQSILAKMKDEIQRALPKHLSGDRFARIALTQVRSNPALLAALGTNDGKASLLGALMQAAQLGLEPGVMGSCYLIPYGGQVQFQLGYRGMIDLARRSGHVKTIYAMDVRENDVFVMSFGVDGTLRHEPCLSGDRGKARGYYAFAELTDGHQYVYMTADEIDHIRKTYSKGKSGPWQTEFDEMAKKTVIKRLFKMLPISIEVPQSDSQVINYDSETGEVYDVTPPMEATEVKPSKAEALTLELTGGDTNEG
jgi:recombination protein RecT